MKTRPARITRAMMGEPRLYVAAIVAMVISALLLYLAPLVPQVVIDGVLLTSGEGPSAFEEFAISENSFIFSIIYPRCLPFT